MTSTEKNTDHVEVKRFVRSVPAKFLPGARKTVAEARTAVRAMYRSSSGFSQPVDDVAFVEGQVVEEDARYDLCDLTSRDEHGPCALQRMQGLCRDYFLPVSSDARAVQNLIKDALAYMGSHRDGDESLLKQKTLLKVINAKLKRLLKTC